MWEPMGLGEIGSLVDGATDNSEEICVWSKDGLGDSASYLSVANNSELIGIATIFLV